MKVYVMRIAITQWHLRFCFEGEQEPNDVEMKNYPHRVLLSVGNNEFDDLPIGVKTCFTLVREGE